MLDKVHLHHLVPYVQYKFDRSRCFRKRNPPHHHGFHAFFWLKQFERAEDLNIIAEIFMIMSFKLVLIRVRSKRKFEISPVK